MAVGLHQCRIAKFSKLGNGMEVSLEVSHEYRFDIADFPKFSGEKTTGPENASVTPPLIWPDHLQKSSDGK